ncbi:MAG: alpha/beta hydrolase [Chloroflexi bacterium]|nr:alpha/beta hydrolase [Chloroflexota bacterium]
MITSLINQFVYRPDATMAPIDFTPAYLSLIYEEVALQTADGLTLSGWYLPAAEPRCVLLYCHGNAGDIRDWVHAAPPFVEAGCSVLMFDYRGYGRSEGRPSEAGLYLDGAAAWNWLRARAEQERLPTAILGKSLGSAVAIQAAVQNPPDKLILDSAFSSMREVVTAVAPWILRTAVPQLYESLDQVPQLTCPTLVIHGGRDALVPLAHGQRLYNALTCPKTMRVIEQAGHNDISAFPEYHRRIVNFL